MLEYVKYNRHALLTHDLMRIAVHQGHGKLKPGVGLVVRAAAWDPRILSSSPVGPLN